jgi:VWFA-related protein
MTLKSIARLVRLCLLGAALAGSGHGQNETASAGQPAVVRLFATIRDKHEKIVSSLTKDDFLLTQDDHPQTIQSFTKDTDLPLTMGLVFDTAMNQAGALDRERSASHDFVDQLMRDDKNKAFVIHFDREVELLQDVTNSRDKLFNALGLLQTARPSQDSGGDSGGSGERGSHHANALYDAIYLACNELMKTQHDRKVLMVISDGIDRRSKETIGSAIESAQRTDTLVYTALTKDEEQAPTNRGFGFPGGGGMGRRGGGTRRAPQETTVDGKKILEQISKETGGGFFEISKKQTMDQIYHSIEEDLRHQYEISYKPEQSGDWSGYHKIVLTTKQKDLVVKAREGFYAGK